MNLSDHLAKLLWIIPPVAIYNLLLMTDVVSVSLLPEVDLLTFIQELTNNPSNLVQENFSLFPRAILLPVFQSYGLEEFALRLPGIGLVVMVVVVWWFFGRKLLGEGLITGGILVLCSSLLLPNVIKFATADAWLLAAQMLSWLSILYLLKKTKLAWQILFYLSLVFGLLTAPLSMGLWTTALLIAYRFLHLEGEKLQMLLLSSLLLSILGFIFFNSSPLFGNYSYLGLLGNIKWQLFGVLPWLGFVIAGIKETYDKFRKREELAILMLGAVLAGFVSGGVILQWVFAVIAGKQLLSYFHPKYPYGNWVRGGAVLLVVLVCLVATTSMIWGYAQLSYAGYRAFMMTGGLFWILSFLGVIGLYIRNHRMITLGFMMSGLLLNFSFWYRLAPVTELSQGWSKQVVEKIASCEVKPISTKLKIYSDQPNESLNLYANNSFQTITYEKLSELPSLKQENGTAVIIVAKDTSKLSSISLRLDTLANQATLWNKVPLVLFQDPCN